MAEEKNDFQAFDGYILNPSLDFRDRVLSLGFTYCDQELAERRMHIVAEGGDVKIITAASFTANGHSYHFDKNKKGRLPSLEERWGIQRATEFIQKYSNIIQSHDTQLTAALMEHIAQLAQHYIDFENELDSYLIAAWIIGTYFHRIFYAFPFIHIKAPKGSGKSQCLNFLLQFSFNAVKARPSVAALGDTVDALRGTYLIDQADSLGRKGNEEILDILADSYKRGGGKRRVMSLDKGHRNVLEFETYGPKAFASIKELPEDLRDRCFLLTLTRSNRTDLSDPDDPFSNWAEQRARLYQVLLTEYITVDALYAAARAEYKTSQTLTGRKLELWLPLEAVLRCFGAEQNIEAIRRRFLAQYGFTEYLPNELEEEVVNAILGSFGAEEQEIIKSPKEISELINDEYFRSSEPKQRAAAVGWVIKKFNLAAEEKPRTSGNKRYLFKKERVESINSSYFKTVEFHASPTPSEEGVENTTPNDVKESGASDLEF